VQQGVESGDGSDKHDPAGDDLGSPASSESTPDPARVIFKVVEDPRSLLELSGGAVRARLEA
jgi:hypothetical protein